MISLKMSDCRISEVAKILSKYPIRSSIYSEKIIFNGEISEKCINELLELGMTIEAISNSEKTDSTVPTAKKSYSSNFITQIKSHSTRISQKSGVYKVVYPTPKYGEIYWVDFGSPFGYEEAFIRPALVVKTDGIFKSITTVIPMSSQVENYTDSSFTPIFKLNAENVVDYTPCRISTNKSSCLLVEQIRTVDNSRLREYICSLEPTFMDSIMKKVKNLFETNVNDEFIPAVSKIPS